MSHIEKIEVVIQSLDPLWMACKELGLPYHVGQKTHTWYGRFVGDTNPNMSKEEIEQFGKCEHAISVPGSGYQIGVYKNKQGDGYYLAYDHYGWNNGRVIEEKLGKNLEKLRQVYSAQVHKLAAKNKGWGYQQKTLPNGKIEVTLSVR